MHNALQRIASKDELEKRIKDDCFSIISAGKGFEPPAARMGYWLSRQIGYVRELCYLRMEKREMIRRFQEIFDNQ
jgi:hypothetical protein